MQQVFCGGTGSAVATRYYYVEGWTSAGTTVQQYAANLIAESGVLSNLKVTLTVAPGAGTSRTFTVMLNGVATSLAVTISDTDVTASITSNPVSVTAGDLIGLRSTSAGAPAATSAYWASEYAPTTAQRAVWGSSIRGDLSTNAATRYNALGGTGQLTFTPTTVAKANVPWGIDTTITKFYIKMDVAPGVGNSWAFTIYKNSVAEVSSTITISDAATSGNVTGLSIDVAPFDVLAVEVVPTSSPDFGSVAYGISYTPDLDGQWNISGVFPDGNDYSDGFFTPFSVGQDSDSVSETTVRIGTATASTFQWLLGGFTAYTETAPGSAETRTYTVRIDGADTLSTVTITGAQVVADIDTTILLGEYATIRLNRSASSLLSDKQSWVFSFGPAIPPGGGGPLPPDNPPNMPPGGPPGDPRPGTRVPQNSFNWNWWRRRRDDENKLADFNPTPPSETAPGTNWQGWRDKHLRDSNIRAQMPYGSPTFPPFILPSVGFSNWDKIVELPHYDDNVEMPR